MDGEGPTVPPPVGPAAGAQKRERAYMPHCDSRILHSPGACEYCDQYPEWQQARVVWRMNFSDTSDPELLPCPSTTTRSAAVRDLWGGNKAKPAGQVDPGWWP